MQLTTEKVRLSVSFDVTAEVENVIGKEEAEEIAKSLIEHNLENLIDGRELDGSYQSIYLAGVNHVNTEEL